MSASDRIWGTGDVLVITLLSLAVVITIFRTVGTTVFCGPQNFEPSHKIVLFLHNCYVSTELCWIQYRLVISFSFQFKSKFAKLSDKTASLLKLTDYFSNQHNSTVTQRTFLPLMRYSPINDYRPMHSDRHVHTLAGIKLCCLVTEAHMCEQIDLSCCLIANQLEVTFACSLSHVQCHGRAKTNLAILFMQTWYFSAAEWLKMLIMIYHAMASIL